MLVLGGVPNFIETPWFSAGGLAGAACGALIAGPWGGVGVPSFLEKNGPNLSRLHKARPLEKTFFRICSGTCVK